MGKKVRCAPTAQTVYGFCGRGFETALMDAALRPDFYAELVRQVAAHQIEIVERLDSLPVDGVMFGDIGATSGA
jgi:hypothetical protein